MNTDELIHDLGLFQISDSFFPTGLYSTSNGLESLFMEKKITSKEELVQFISAQLVQQLGPCDCVALANTIKLAQKNQLDSILKLDEMLFVIKGIKEIRDTSCRMGMQLLKTVTKFKGHTILAKFLEHTQNNMTPCTYPVAFGICCVTLGIDKEKSLLSFLYGFVVSIVGAALRLGLVQHFQGQEVIHELKIILVKTIQENKNKTIHEIWQFSPQIDIYQMHHEKMDSKMFIT